MLIFLALIIGILINYFTGGLDFNQNLCIVAGLFLIMPSLLNFKFKDLIYFKNHKLLFLLNILFNFVIIPAIFLLVSYLIFGADPIVFSFLLLGMIPGGGLLISWVMKSSGNLKLAFSLFLANLFIFAILFIPYAKILDYLGEKVLEEKNSQELQLKPDLGAKNSLNFGLNKFNNNFNVLEEEKEPQGCVISKVSEKLACPGLGEVGASKSAFVALFVLIIFPFIISRFILLSKKLTNFLKPKVKIISSIATFFIIAYIFSIKEVHNIFTIDYNILLKISFGVILSYLIIYKILYLVYKKVGKNEDSIAFFWNGATRFLTLGLIFSFFYVKTFGIDFLLVFVVAYFVQVIGSNIIYLKFKKDLKKL